MRRILLFTVLALLIMLFNPKTLMTIQKAGNAATADLSPAAWLAVATVCGVAWIVLSRTKKR